MIKNIMEMEEDDCPICLLNLSSVSLDGLSIYSNVDYCPYFCLEIQDV